MYNLLHKEISATGYQTKLKKLQNRPARILTFSNYETLSSVLLDELGRESVENKRFKNKWLWLCILHNNLPPSHLRRIFVPTPQTYKHTIFFFIFYYYYYLQYYLQKYTIYYITYTTRTTCNTGLNYVFFPFYTHRTREKMKRKKKRKRRERYYLLHLYFRYVS